MQETLFTAIAAGRYAGPPTKGRTQTSAPRTVSELLERWLALRSDRCATTLESYRNQIRALLQESPGDSPIRTIAAGDVRAALSRIRGRVGAARGIPKEPEPFREVELTAVDLDRILEHSDPWLRPILALKICVGARRGDLFGEWYKPGDQKPPLYWHNVDLAKRSVRFVDRKEARTANRRTGKGERAGVVVDIPGAAVEVLLALATRKRWENEKALAARDGKPPGRCPCSSASGIGRRPRTG